MMPMQILHNNILPLLKDPIRVNLKEGLTFIIMNSCIYIIIQKEESELKLWLNDYNKKPFDKERNNLCSDVEKKKIDHPIAHKLFFHILNNANEKTTPITPIIT
jgi:hypothetical protein